MAAETLLYPEAYQEFDYERFFAQAPEPMQDTSAFVVPRLQVVAERVYGLQQRPTLEALGRDNLGRMLGGIAGTYIETAEQRLQTVLPKIGMLAMNLRDFSDEAIAQRFNRTASTVGAYRRQMTRSFETLAPPLEGVVEALGGEMQPSLSEVRRKLKQERKAQASSETASTSSVTRNDLTPGGLIVLNEIITSLHGETWPAKAACTASNPELFHVKSANDAKDAIKICRTCPVLADCLYESLIEQDSDEYVELNVRGGMTVYERRAYIAKLNAKGARLNLVPQEIPAPQEA